MRARGTVYRGKTGMWAFAAHRITGVLVFLFLLLHIVDVSLAGISGNAYNTIHAVYGNVVLRLFEVGLLAALVWHALNGLRIIAVDFFDAAIRAQKQLAIGIAIVTVVVAGFGAIVMLWPFFTNGRTPW